LRNIIVADERECVKHCRDTQDCVSLTFRESDNRCYLKSKRGGSVGPLQASGHNSMNMECDNSEVDNLDCIREGFNFPGADLRNIIVADERECVKHCRDTQDCVSLTFRESDNRCYLRSKRGGSSGPAPTAGHNSMNMECDNSEPDLSSAREDTDFPGSDIKYLNNIMDLEACVRLCWDTEDCVAVSYSRDLNRCNLKRKTFDWWQEKPTSNSVSINM